MIPATVPAAIAMVVTLLLLLLEEEELDGVGRLAVVVAELVMKLVVVEKTVVTLTSLLFSMKPMVEASLRVNPDMMLAPTMPQHEGGGLTVKAPQQKVPPEIEHCDNSGVFPTLVIWRQNCGHDEVDQFLSVQDPIAYVPEY